MTPLCARWIIPSSILPLLPARDLERDFFFRDFDFERDLLRGFLEVRDFERLRRLREFRELRRRDLDRRRDLRRLRCGILIRA